MKWGEQSSTPHVTSKKTSVRNHFTAARACTDNNECTLKYNTWFTKLAQMALLCHVNSKV